MWNFYFISILSQTSLKFEESMVYLRLIYENIRNLYLEKLKVFVKNVKITFKKFLLSRNQIRHTDNKSIFIEKSSNGKDFA